MPEPAAITARKTLAWAIRTHRARRWPCFRCSIGSRYTEPHFEDPLQPLRVLWYCKACWKPVKRQLSLEQKERYAKQQDLLQQYAWGEHVQKKFIELKQSPEIFIQLEGEVRASLPEKLTFLRSDAPLFQQMIVLHSYKSQ